MNLFVPVKFFPSKFLSKKNNRNLFELANLNMKGENLNNFKNSWAMKNPESIKINRFRTDDSIKDVLVKLQKNYNQNKFFDICFVNRDFLSFSLLYRLTAFKLKTEINSENLVQKEGIEAFRKKILKNILFIDQATTQGIIFAEKRIKQILSSRVLQEDDIIKIIGDDEASLAFFWIVIKAALIAWEKKEKTESEKNVYETYEKLKKIDEILTDNEKYSEILPFELKYIENLLKKKKDDNYFEEFELNYLEGFRILISQLEKLPSNSYGLFLKKISKIYSQKMEKNFASKIETFDCIKIKLPLSNFKNISKLIDVPKNYN
jgi:hypothetical protein